METVGTHTIETSQKSHPGFRMRFFGAGWYLAAGLSIGILLASIPGYLSAPVMGVFEGRVIIGQDFLSQALLKLIFFLSFTSSLVSILLAVWLYAKKSDEPIGLFLSYFLLAHGIIFGGSIELLAWFWPAAPWVNSFLLTPLFSGPLTMALVGIFPDGRFVPRWSVWLIPFSTLGTLLAFLQLGFVNLLDGPVSLDFAQALTILFSIVVVAGAIIAQVYRYRRVSTPKQKRQTRWVLYSLVLWFITVGIISIPWSRALALPEGSPLPLSVMFGTVAWTLSSFFLPAALTIAVLREGLFEIDLIINRSLVYAGLTAFVIGIYVLIVGALSTLLQARDNLVVSMIATGVVAVLFQPLRESLQKRVNRLMFGQRDDPVRVLNRLGEQIERGSPPNDLLHDILKTVVESLKLPYAAIELVTDKGTRTAAAIGNPPQETERLPLVSQGEHLGELVVGERRGSSFDRAERRLLENIARQTGAAVRAGQLLQELQLSRQQIVTAREEERRRLRRDLHDGIGPTMASQTLKLDAVLDLLEAGAPDREAGSKQAKTLLRQLKNQTQETVRSIRQIVYALRPPALDNLGLGPALQSYIDQQVNTGGSLAITLELQPEALSGLPAAVEVAAYRIVIEALTNVRQHAEARHCRVRLSEASNGQPALAIEITDDGKGLPEGQIPGVGLAAMRERAEELGGRFRLDTGGWGTRIQVEIPYTREPTP